MLSRVKRFAKGVDDKVQGYARSVYGADDENKYDTNTLKGKVAAFGHLMHPRFGIDGVEDVGVGLTRAAQAGGITAAGYGLMKLTEQFGGAADQQEPGQLSLSDEEQETYNRIKAVQGALLVGGAAALGYKAGEMYRNRKLS